MNLGRRREGSPSRRCGLALLIACTMLPSLSAAGSCKGPACRMHKEVAIEPVWTHPVERTHRPPDRIVVTGAIKNAIFTPTAVTIPFPSEELTDEPASLPLLENLAPLFTFRIFGIEERVSVERHAQGFVVRCGSGDRPAGAAFSAKGFRYPRAMRGDLVLEGRTASDFSFAVVANGADAPEQPASSLADGLLASIRAGEWNDGDPRRELIVSCPPCAGTVTISAIVLVPRPSVEGTGAGTWIWDVEPWWDQAERLLLLLRHRKADEVFLQVPIGGGVADFGRIQRLIETLSAGGIGVHAVEGDPDMVTRAGRAHALERARILRRLVETTRLRSVQYDIEPYLRPDHSADPVADWRAWAETIRELAAALGGKIDVVMPFWMMDRPAGQQALESVQGALSGVSVMAYRTDLVEIERIAERWLSWGESRDLAIGIALENGPLATEVHKTFVRAESGQVALDRSAEQHSVLLFADRISDSYARPVYSFSHEVEVPASRISFLGHQEALTRARQRLSRTLSAWGSFRGLLVHELITTGD
jgi:hypothetical protein